jgi:hypothetical protein
MRQRFAHSRKVGGDAAALARRTRNLQRAFLSHTDEQIKEALEVSGGHAGRAAAKLAALENKTNGRCSPAKRKTMRRSKVVMAGFAPGAAAIKERVRRMLTDVFGRALAWRSDAALACPRVPSATARGMIRSLCAERAALHDVAGLACCAWRQCTRRRTL